MIVFKFRARCSKQRRNDPDYQMRGMAQALIDKAGARNEVLIDARTRNLWPAPPPQPDVPNALWQDRRQWRPRWDCWQGASDTTTRVRVIGVIS